VEVVEVGPQRGGGGEGDECGGCDEEGFLHWVDGKGGLGTDWLSGYSGWGKLLGVCDWF
jgi:hypothetical protein